MNRFSSTVSSSRLDIQWQRLDQPAIERATVFAENRGWILAGVVDGTLETGAVYQVRYSVRCAGDWTTREAVVDGHLGDAPISIALERDAATSTWTLNGEPQPQVKGCIDVDLGFSPITNTLPIRRLDLPVREGADVRAAWLRFPEMRLEPLDQRYARVDVHCYRYESDRGRFSASLKVDEKGIVVQYDRYWVGSVMANGR